MWQLIGNLFVAMGLGALVGFERQWRQRTAGLQTNALVALGSALFVQLSRLNGPASDGMRIAAQVVTGVGFLCAGVIMRDGYSVRGLNTAAALWCSSAIGVLAGYGAWLLAAVGTLAVVLGNILLRSIARFINMAPAVQAEHAVVYQIQVICRDEVEKQIRFVLLQAIASRAHLILLSLKSREIDQAKIEIRAIVEAPIQAAQSRDVMLEEIVGRMVLEQGVLEANWTIGSGIRTQQPLNQGA